MGTKIELAATWAPDGQAGDLEMGTKAELAPWTLNGQFLRRFLLS